MLIPFDSPLFDRTRLLIGDAGITRLHTSHVLVVGLGGVGAFAAEALARAGVGALTLVDHDRVEPTNLNRQLIALNSTLGRLKTEVLAERLADIAPDCRVTLISEFMTAEQIDPLLAVGFDQVIDAIDSLASKVALIETAYRLHIPIVSSMGAGGRLDPTRIQVGDLMDTQVCALARSVRLRARRLGVGRGVTVVWSDEPARRSAPLPHATHPERPRPAIGTLSYLPAMFGLMLAGMVVRRILGETAI
ncbi:tRNA A37 threonylcarbamoyladenosine dehydratase [Allochromatium warmingii]|uniref:tRNA A37 threonylcarbamoyladenosine dehydratase n=1 Tax=Allochromatium warmingii TaxID=61595 RepID=A0A1H3C696_ALLWA|nr:tRNA A37 threonylcarbamoyladenosine dehydratase [Allochromatium warmingii]